MINSLAPTNASPRAADTDLDSAAAMSLPASAPLDEDLLVACADIDIFPDKTPRAVAIDRVAPESAIAAILPATVPRDVAIDVPRAEDAIAPATAPRD